MEKLTDKLGLGRSDAVREAIFLIYLDGFVEFLDYFRYDVDRRQAMKLLTLFLRKNRIRMQEDGSIIWGALGENVPIGFSTKGV